MSLTINHNQMAGNVARSLNRQYLNLASSTRRLASGLRINSAADDAAGLAIRELQRADIAALNQGVRNANDAISLIQTADGALGVIDEKLIRMKELAEQASTGTYNSTQRLMIDSEYQEMAKEISRIANATDFNGIHLLNGNLESNMHDGSGLVSKGQLKVHFGSGNSSAEDYYYIEIGDVTAEAMGLGENSTFAFLQKKAVDTFGNYIETALAWMKTGTAYEQERYPLVVEDLTRNLDDTLTLFANPPSQDEYAKTLVRWNSMPPVPGRPAFYLEGVDPEMRDKKPPATLAAFQALPEEERNRWAFTWAKATLYNLSIWDDVSKSYYLGTTRMVTIDTNIIPTGDPVRNALRAKIRESINAGLILAKDTTNVITAHGKNIKTQENAQRALVAIDRAIEYKDKIRANLGAMQNRLENTVTNLTTQAENLQAAESRISDTDIATEMTQFVRNQILTQSAVAMLTQANSLPQMAMQLISG